MGKINVNIENNRIVQTEKGAFDFEFDGLYYLHYGERKMHRYNGEVYDCFPIVILTEDLSFIEVTLFGCKGANMVTDGYLYNVPMDYDEWPELKPFITQEVYRVAYYFISKLFTDATECKEVTDELIDSIVSDVLECADVNNFNNDDVLLAIQRTMYSKLIKNN